MLKSRVVRIGLLAVVAVLALGAVLVFRAIDTGPNASAAPGAQDEEQEAQDQETPWLGVYFVRAADGVTIAWVIADSPADAAGLQRGDVIKAVDGTEVETPQDFRDAIQDKAVGDTVTLSIERDGQAQDVSATLAARPDPLPQAIPLLPELEGIPVDELFGHVQGGEFNFTDEQGNPFTVTIDVGTIASVDDDANALTVDLNAGGSKTYTVEDDDLGVDLADLEEGDRVAVMSVGDDVRAVFPGKALMVPGFGGHGFGIGRGPMGPFEGLEVGPLEKFQEWREGGPLEKFREWRQGFGGPMMPDEEEDTPEAAPTPGSSTGL
ncbi:MAG TPA: PDZ domain-containing protein [Dehalococcoidia bacterium]|nr:PDZ domain-containing protein [Dehalococcoidia bacterium]